MLRLVGAAGTLRTSRTVAEPVGGGTFSGRLLNWNREQLKRTPAPKPEPKPAPAPAPTAAAAGGTYTVQAGDSLSKIAQRVLGDMNRWKELFELNRDQISNPNLIYPGQTIKLPGAPAPKPEPKPVAQPKPEPKPSTYTVRSGDSLSAIAQRTLGDSNRWREIYDLNRDQISNPNVIQAGMVLKLPGGAHAPAPVPPPNSGPPSGDLAPLPFSPDEIARRLGMPVANVRKYAPYIAEAMREHGITDRATAIAVLATIKVETGRFEPIPEYASGAAYEGRKDLGNVHPGDGVRYKGRGFIQLTGRANYRSYGQKLGINLEGNPDLALEPRTSARILVRYFKDRNIDDMARAGDWRGVRRAVNGGYNGWDAFIGAVNALGPGGGGAPTTPSFFQRAFDWVRDRLQSIFT